MMWSITGKPVPVERFTPFVADELLYEFEGPRIFTVTDNDGELFLAYWCDESEAEQRYIVVPTSRSILQGLKSGCVSVLEALDQPRCWLCETTLDGALVACQRVEFEDLPRECLPAAGVLLYAHLKQQERHGPAGLSGR